MATRREFGIGVVAIACTCALTLGGVFGAYNLTFAPQMPGGIPVSGLSLPLSIYGTLAAGPALLVAIALAVRLVRRKRLTGLELGAAILSVGSFAFGVGTINAQRRFDRDKSAWLDEAIEYCNRVRPELERWRTEHGAYPRDLEALHVDGPPPFLARTGDLRYEASDKRYQFEINTSRGLSFFGAIFTSDGDGWTYFR